MALAAAPAVGIHEAWTKKRGLLGWIVNIVVTLVGPVLFAPLGGMVVVLILSPFMDSSSLAATGGAVMYFAVAGIMLVTLLSASVALWIVNRGDELAQHFTSLIWLATPTRFERATYRLGICRSILLSYGA